MYKLYVVSDGTGRTAQQALSAALMQFPDAEVDIIVQTKVKSVDKIKKVVDLAAKAGGFIVHTLVTDSLRGELIDCCRKQNVENIDLMGPFLVRLSEMLDDSPSEKPGLFTQLNREYFRRIETMEFALRHDDGQRVEEIKRAEIVLLGVSRTFKTPLSIYLAFKGWFVANVPIVIGQEPSKLLKNINPKRVFCLDTNARRLAELRQTRHEFLKGEAGDYSDPEFVRIELMHARQFYAKNSKWTILNVTNKPIEEIASEILSILKMNNKS